MSAYGGHYCAWHRYNGVYDQNGLLATPLISIPADGNTTMTFKTYEQYPGDYGYEGVWVIEGGHKASVEVWTQTEPSAEWKTVSIDLSAYQGKNVQIDVMNSEAVTYSEFSNALSNPLSNILSSSIFSCLK